MTKKINIFLIMAVVFATACAALLTISTVHMGNHVSVAFKNRNWIPLNEVFRKNCLHFSATLISALFCVCVAALLIYLLYRINKTELLAATEDVNAYRKRKAAERNASRKAKAEKKKAAIERELAALNSVEKNEFSEK